MRKALIGIILAATVMTPVAAQAQEWGRGERGRARAERAQQRAPDVRAEQQEQRVERREERREARIERPVQRQQVQVEQRRDPAQFERRREAQLERRGDALRNFQREAAQREAAEREAVQVVQRERRGDRAGRSGSDYPSAWQGNPNDPMRRHYEELERRNQSRYQDRRDWRDERRDDRRDWRNDDRRDWRYRDRRDWRDERRDWNRDWNRSWRYDNRYDWQGWRYRNRNIYRGSSYYAPYRNHRYSRFGIGFFLEPMFYSQRYWIGDPYYYRLPPAPPGTQWIRYYDDVLLVDLYSGEVVDVIYDFFW
jgi:hypothetical protein